MSRIALIALLCGSAAARADTASIAVRGGSAYVAGRDDRFTATGGIEALWRNGALLLGGSIDASAQVSILTGDARHLFFAAAAGASFELTPRIRLDLLGEAGAHRFSGTRSGPFRIVAGGEPPDGVDVFLGSDPLWTPYLGARPSLELLFDRLAVGVSTWARADLRKLYPVPFLDPAPFPTQAQRVSLDRFATGADLHVAWRFR